VKRALALHVVERGLHPENFRRAEVDGEWFSGNWVVAMRRPTGLLAGGCICMTRGWSRRIAAMSTALVGSEE
jgi:hypothetical protein